jgi:hypothetical protein
MMIYCGGDAQRLVHSAEVAVLVGDQLSRQLRRGAFAPSPGAPNGSLPVCKQHNESNLQISSRKNGPLWQKNGGLTGNILHFFSCFFGLLGFFALQAVAFQEQARSKPLPKKSYLKTYGRFFVFYRLV